VLNNVCSIDATIVETQRLILRPWLVDDADALLSILQEKDILRYFPPTEPRTIHQVRKYISFHHKHWQQHGYGHWAVIERESGRLIGWNGLEYLPETDETEVAYLLSREFWGRGYASEAGLAAVRFGLDQAGLRQIIGLVHPENIASRRVLEKCGLRFVDCKTYFGMLLCRYRIESEPSSTP
jgi:ribosomal-protein-alanine N-acetyltransferase